jgi:hypothetical protein
MRRRLRWKQQRGPGREAAADTPAADVSVATSEAPTMDISFFSITGIFSSVVEKMMGQERRLQ